MCKSTKICDETRNMVLKFFFRAQLPVVVFLVVCIYFFYDNFLLFRKMAKKHFSSSLSHLAQKWSNQSFKKEIKTRKKCFNSLF